MATPYVERRYSNKIITGYTVDTGEYKFEKLTTVCKTRDGGLSKPFPVTITNSSGQLLKGIQSELEKLLGPITEWDKLIGKTLSIPCKMFILDMEGKHSALATHSSKSSIIGPDDFEPVWTDDEVNMLKKGLKNKAIATSMAVEAPVVNTSNEDF
jgi:hypothetical protein